MAFASEQLDGWAAELGGLETQFRDDHRAYLGEKIGTAYAGAGVTAARALAARLNSEPMATARQRDLWLRACAIIPN